MSDMSGPAFPVGSGDMRDPTGLTKRELFAAMAMQAMLNTELRKELFASMAGIAAESFKMADAMIAELQK